MITLKTPEELAIMAEAGKKLARVLKLLAKEVRPGMETLVLEKLSRKYIKESDADPAFLGYKPAGADKAYPYSLCLSVNDTVVHGRPSHYVIQNGDLVKLDLGLRYKKFYVDSAVTVGAGKISADLQRLIRATEDALARGITAAKPGKTLGDVGYEIERHVKKNGFSVVQSLTGHGIGRELHEDPYVLNFGRPHQGEAIEVGMVLAIEPMVALGSGLVRQLKDDSFVTADSSFAAHFEHTVAITKNGPKILTRA